MLVKVMLSLDGNVTLICIQKVIQIQPKYNFKANLVELNPNRRNVIPRTSIQIDTI
jgi:hypothetical protein